jgi:hypothetical protein
LGKYCVPSNYSGAFFINQTFDGDTTLTRNYQHQTSVKEAALDSPKIGFVAYASQPGWIGKTIEAGLHKYQQFNGPSNFSSWEENDIAGRFLATPILVKIQTSKCLVADISTLNFNVTYEIGYAIGSGKRVIISRNKSIITDENEIKRVGIFDTLGYKNYENSDGFYDIITSISDFDPIPISNKVDTSAPVWMLQYPHKTDLQGQIVARVKKTRIRYRSFDPTEQSRLSANEAIEGIGASFGVIIPLAPDSMDGSKVHNLRAAFCAGLCHGMGKYAIILQSGEGPVPLDYRDLVQYCTHPGQVDDHIVDLASQITEDLQSSEDSGNEPSGLLFKLDMGSSTAENEFTHLGSYYLQTDEYRRALRGEVRIVVGRKGAGKTAVFAQVRDHVRQDKNNIVLDLKPEGYQLRKFKEQIIDYVDSGTAEHTVTAFWEFVLLREIVRKILEKDSQVHLRNHKLFDPYQKLSLSYSKEIEIREGDFSERMMGLVERIVSDFSEKHKSSSTPIRLNASQVTELIYSYNIKELSDNLFEYLKFKGQVWVLFDNLDKGWATHGVSEADLLLIRCLLDASRKLERSFEIKNLEMHTIVFMRNDIYQLLIDSTPDRGKEIRTSLDWSDGDLLRQLVKRRLVYNGMPEQSSFEMLWRQICVPFYSGEESSQYLIDRSLMRPRFLLNIISHCRGFAVNLEHEKIDETDIEKGLSAYSTDLIYDIDLEIRDVLNFAEDVLYNFLGVRSTISIEQINQILIESGFDENQSEKIFEILLWYGVLGVLREGGEVSYIYNVNYDIKRLNVLINKIKPDAPRIVINPAFWSGLEIEIDTSAQLHFPDV